MTETHRVIVAAGLLAIGCVLAIQCAMQPPPYVDHHDGEPGVFSSSPRSPRWPSVRNRFLRKHPRCEACGSADRINVHHIVPFHERPDLELVEENLITLCFDHHLRVGHACRDGGSSWSRCSNPNVREDATRIRNTKQ